jgi:hypothetical protein
VTGGIGDAAAGSVAVFGLQAQQPAPADRSLEGSARHRIHRPILSGNSAVAVRGLIAARGTIAFPSDSQSGDLRRHRPE